MASPASSAARRGDLDRFLLAQVGTEPNGMGLTVLSILARNGDDPWEKAGHLAAACETAARDELARIILQARTKACEPGEAAAIAARLVSLLPPELRGCSAAAQPGASEMAWIGTALLYGVLGASLVLNTVVQRARIADAGPDAPRLESQMPAPKLPPS